MQTNNKKPIPESTGSCGRVSSKSFGASPIVEEPTRKQTVNLKEGQTMEIRMPISAKLIHITPISMHHLAGRDRLEISVSFDSGKSLHHGMLCKKEINSPNSRETLAFGSKDSVDGGFWLIGLTFISFKVVELDVRVYTITIEGPVKMRSSNSN